MTDQEQVEPAEAREKTNVPDPFVGIVADLADVGRHWARHGLDLGQQALMNTARTLELTAATLAKVADRLRSDQP